MIGVRLEGRLGNQLFQYAFIICTAKKLNTDFFIDKTIEPFIVGKYFNIPRGTFYLLDKYIFSIKGFKNIFNHHLRIRFYKLVKNSHNLKELNFSNFNKPATELKKIKNRTLYQGFFQSELYFNECKHLVKKYFVVKERYCEAYRKIIKTLPLNQTLIVVHIRKGDYIHLGLNLPISYFHKAIKEIKSPNAFYVFLSDEPDSIKNEFKYISNKYISRNTEIVDLQFLMNADICILSNSSFSWWGAYLSKKESPKIYAPQYFLGFKEKATVPVDIYPDDWNIINLC